MAKRMWIVLAAFAGAAAAQGVREWAEREWGQDGRYVVRRTWAEEVNRARRTPVPSAVSC